MQGVCELYQERYEKKGREISEGHKLKIFGCRMQNREYKCGRNRGKTVFFCPEDSWFISTYLFLFIFAKNQDKYLTKLICGLLRLKEDWGYLFLC
jgi:hypothetical protein